MKQLLLLFFLFIFFFGYSQTLQNTNFIDGIEIVPCTFDTTVSITKPVHWNFYQTINGQWDGPIDSSQCISGEEWIINGRKRGFRIPVDQVNLDQPLFVKAEISPQSILLEKNWLYRSYGYIPMDFKPILDLSSNCPGDLCTGVITEIQIPDATGMGVAQRIYKGGLDKFDSGEISGCVPTEYFDEQFLQTFILKITIDPALMNEAYFSFGSLDLEPYDEFWGFETLDSLEVSASNWNGSSYNVFFWDFSNFAAAYLFKYPSYPLYPSPSNEGLFEVKLEENVPDARIINILIDMYQSVVFQPFTTLVGGLVEGSDSIRHQVNLEMTGGNLCLSDIVELPINKDQHFTYSSGQIEYNGKSACLQIRNGGSLHVKDKATMHLGNQGEGMLMLRPGAIVDLEPHTELFIDQTLWIMEQSADDPPGQVYIELPPHTRLTFTENARITNRYSIDGSIRLNVVMKGGILDDRQLDAQSKALINQIYPEPTPIWLDRINVSPNPANGPVTIQYHSEGKETLNVALTDQYGRPLQEIGFEAQKGIQEFVMDINRPSGMYLLQMDNGRNRGTKKLMIIGN